MAAVELRTATLDVGDAEVARLSELLDHDERARAERFRFARDRRRFIVRRARLREWLGEHVGEAPDRLAFARSDHGKPALTGGPCFSLSHSGDLMMLAVADVEIGCDIEWIDLALDWQPLARSLFARPEYGALDALPAAAARRAFFECWARKEAFVKAIGLGLSYPLEAFTVSVGARARLIDGAPGWAIASSSPDAHYAGAVVAHDDGTPLSIRIASDTLPIAA